MPAALEMLDPSPGVALRDSERFEYAITEPGREPARGTISAARKDNGWVLEQRYEAGGGVDHTTSTVNEALRPASTARTLEWAGGGETHGLEYRPADKRVMSTRTKNGKTDTRELKLRDNAYDNESAFWLWRSLPLAEGYTARYVSVNAYERSQSLVTLTVIGHAEVTVPAGTFDAWRVLVVSGRAARTAWIEVAPPHRLVQWDNGGAVMQLTGGR